MYVGYTRNTKQETRNRQKKTKPKLKNRRTAAFTPSLNTCPPFFLCFSFSFLLRIFVFFIFSFLFHFFKYVYDTSTVPVHLRQQYIFIYRAYLFFLFFSFFYKIEINPVEYRVHGLFSVFGALCFCAARQQLAQRDVCCVRWEWTSTHPPRSSSR